MAKNEKQDAPSSDEVREFTFSGNVAKGYNAEISAIAEIGGNLYALKGDSDRGIALRVSKLWTSYWPKAKADGVEPDKFTKQCNADIRRKNPDASSAIRQTLNRAWTVVRSPLPEARKVAKDWADGKYNVQKGETLQGMASRVRKAEAGESDKPQRPKLEAVVAWLVYSHLHPSADGAYTVKMLQDATRKAVSEAAKATRQAAVAA